MFSNILKDKYPYLRKFFFALYLFTFLVAKGGGTIGVRAYFLPSEEISNVVALRYHLRVNNNLSPDLKIIFGTKRFYNPESIDTYLLEANLYTNRVVYTDTSCAGWPPYGQYIFKQSGLWISIPDYIRKGRVGVRQANQVTEAMFPRQNSGIDLISGLTKIETISQMDVTGKDIYLEYSRGEAFTSPLNGWGHRFMTDTVTEAVTCEENLSDGIVYQIWNLTATIDNEKYKWEFALPYNDARYFAPWEITSFTTEFLEPPGFFQAYFWGFEIQREGNITWEPLKKWEVDYNADGYPNSTCGAKIGTYDGHQVIEISNDSTDTYYKLGNIFELNPPTPVMNDGMAVPTNFVLHQNYPNPFNPITTINFSIPGTHFVTLKVYDILGREIETLINEEKTVGNYKLTFDGSNFKSGIYFYRISSGGSTHAKKMIFLK